MIKSLLIILLISTFIYADNHKKFSKYLKDKNYIKACQVGKKLVYAQEKDENLLSLIAQICLKCDNTFPVAVVQHRLKKTKASRANAVAFSSVLLQKKLIYHFMYDDADISTLALPLLDHPLCDTFVAIRDGNYTVTAKNPKAIEFDKKNQHYKVYIDVENDGVIVIQIRDAQNFISQHRYL